MVENLSEEQKTGSGTIDFDEFCLMMYRQMQAEEEAKAPVRDERELSEAFRLFDLDGNGFIDWDELKAAMEGTGEDIECWEVDDMMADGDKNNDYQIDFEESYRSFTLEIWVVTAHSVRIFDMELDVKDGIEVQSKIPRRARHSEENTRCGYLGCYPPCFQVFASAKWFLAFISIFVLFQSLLVSGYLSSVITTMEKRYDLRSAEAGLIVSSFDIGSLLVVVFISYFGGKGHRPRWVGIGATIVAAGAFMFSTPQYISSPYEVPGSQNSTGGQDTQLCNQTGDGYTDDEACEAKSASSLYIALFVLSNMIIGIGSTPIYTLGTTFIYDNSPSDDSSLYIAILYLMGAIGPALGYVVGGLLISYYVDPWADTVLPADDPRYIGAWWSGYVLSAILIFFSAIPILGFPNSISRSQSDTPSNCSDSTSGSDVGVARQRNDDVNAADASMNFGKNLKDLPRSFASLLTNPIFLCITVTATLEFSIVTAFLTFVPKYLQDQFGVDPSQASILTGVVLVPSAGGGIMTGGYIIKRLRLNMAGCAKVALVSNLVAIALFLSVFLIDCPANVVIGSDGLGCAACACASTRYDPVCVDASTFYNPCFAGCTDVEYSNDSHNSATEYSNCGCSTGNGTAIPGACERDCTKYFVPFMVCLFFVTMATASAQTPALMVTLRCVNNDERPFAMGLQFVFFRALAYIPAPIYFGTAIDGACQIWSGSSDGCDVTSGSCEVYDPQMFRFIYFGLAMSLKVLAGVFVFLAFVLCRRKHARSKREQQDTKTTSSCDTYGSVNGRQTATNSQLQVYAISSESESSLGSAGSQKPLMMSQGRADKRSRADLAKNDSCRMSDVAL